MNSRMLLPVAILALLMGLGIGTASMAQQGKGQAGGGEGRHHMMHGYGGCGAYSWREGLSQAQQDKILQMKVDYLKLKYPKKARMKTIKMELAVLATSNNPDQKVIDAKINEVLALKKEIMKAKYAHKIAVRKELKSEQRAAFDKHILKNAKGKRRYCGHH